jgi:hypothetical protein
MHNCVWLHEVRCGSGGISLHNVVARIFGTGVSNRTTLSKSWQWPDMSSQLHVAFLGDVSEFTHLCTNTHRHTLALDREEISDQLLTVHLTP